MDEGRPLLKGLKEYVEKRKTNLLYDLTLPPIISPLIVVLLSILAIQSQRVLNYVKTHNELWTLMAVLFAVVLLLQNRSLGGKVKTLSADISRQVSSLERRVNGIATFDIVIVSDEKTSFAGSSRYPNINPGTHAKDCKHPKWKKLDRRYDVEFCHAKWIAHTDYDSEEEVVGDGDYKFMRTFDCPVGKEYIRTAALCLLVDDECEVTVNGHKLPVARGFKEPSRFYLNDYIEEGPNSMFFAISNERSKTRKASHQNTYGLRFCLKIEHILPWPS